MDEPQKILGTAKETSYKRPHTTMSLMGMFTISKSIEMESKLVVTRAWGWEPGLTENRDGGIW